MIPGKKEYLTTDVISSHRGKDPHICVIGDANLGSGNANMNQLEGTIGALKNYPLEILVVLTTGMLLVRLAVEFKDQFVI